VGPTIFFVSSRRPARNAPRPQLKRGCNPYGDGVLGLVNPNCLPMTIIVPAVQVASTNQLESTETLCGISTDEN
jgi:hypothetical protein